MMTSYYLPVTILAEKTKWTNYEDDNFLGIDWSKKLIVICLYYCHWTVSNQTVTSVISQIDDLEKLRTARMEMVTTRSINIIHRDMLTTVYWHISRYQFPHNSNLVLAIRWCDLM